jgi:hypothetical protein
VVKATDLHINPETVCRAIIQDEAWKGVIEAIAQSVELAHRFARSKWGFRLGNDSIMLKVGPHEILEIVHHRPFHILVDRPSVPEKLRKRRELEFSDDVDANGNSGAMGFYPSNPGSESCNMLVADVPRFYPHLRLAHERVIKRAAVGRLLPNTRSTHSMALVSFLASHVGRILPQPSYADELWPAVGENPSDAGSPERAPMTICRIVRDTELARQVKVLHDFECQICGHTIQLPDGSRYAESHHIQPLGEPHNGPDVAENILCVCPNHHAELDYCVKSISIPSLRVAGGHQLDKEYVDYHNERIRAQEAN